MPIGLLAIAAPSAFCAWENSFVPASASFTFPWNNPSRYCPSDNSTLYIRPVYFAASICSAYRPITVLAFFHQEVPFSTALPSLDVDSPKLFVILRPLYADTKLKITGIAVREFSATSLNPSAVNGSIVLARPAPAEAISLSGSIIPAAASLVPAILSVTSSNTLPSSETTPLSPPALNASCRRST